MESKSLNVSYFLNESMFDTPEDFRDSAWLEHGNFAFWLVEELKPKRVVELGTHNGFSLLAFCQAISKLKIESKCFAIDSWEGDAHTGSYSSDVLTDLRDIHDQKYSSFSVLMQMYFEDALSHFDDASIDLLHIDGLHTDDAVKKDFESWFPKLSSKAIVLFHDINVRQTDFGVHRFWSEIKTDFPHFAFDHGYGLGVLVVGSETNTRLMELCTFENFLKFSEIFALLGRGTLNAWHKHELREALRDLHSVSSQTINQLQDKNLQLQGEVKEMSSLSQLHLSRIRALENSLSFKLAKPFRALANLLGN